MTTEYFSDCRLMETARILSAQLEEFKIKHPFHVPITVSLHKGLAGAGVTIRKKRYLVERYSKVSNFLYIIRRYLNNINPSLSLYFITEDGEILSPGSYVSLCYNTYKDSRKTNDNIMFNLTLAGENTFGMLQ